MNHDPLEMMAYWFGAWQRGYQAVWESYGRWWTTMAIPEMGRQEVGQTPAGTIHQLDRVKVVRYHPQTEQQYARPVLCVPSLINRHYILDLLRDRSLVAYLLQRGLNLYLLNWGDPGPADRELTFDAHISHYLRQAVAAVRADSGAEQVLLLGYCMGGMFTSIYASLFGAEVAGLVNLAGPINYHDDGIFSLLTRAEWFDVDLLVDAYGNVPADLLSWTFQMLHPTSHLVRLMGLAERLEDRQYVRSFAAMQSWIFDQVAFPGEAFRRYIKAFYQGNELLSGRFTLDDHPVDLAKIVCPVLTIASPHDETAPAGSVTILNERISSPDQSQLLLHGPHVGMVAGRKAPQTLWPHLANWLIAHSDKANVSPITHHS